MFMPLLIRIDVLAHEVLEARLERFHDLGVLIGDVAVLEKLCAAAGFEQIDAIAPEVDGKFMSAFVRARKPALRQS